MSNSKEKNHRESLKLVLLITKVLAWGMLPIGAWLIIQSLLLMVGLSKFVATSIIPVNQSSIIRWIFSLVLTGLWMAWSYIWFILVVLFLAYVSEITEALHASIDSFSSLEESRRKLSLGIEELKTSRYDAERCRHKNEELLKEVESLTSALTRSNEIAEHRLKQLNKIRNEALSSQISSSGIAKEINSELLACKKIIENKDIQIENVSRQLATESSERKKLQELSENLSVDLNNCRKHYLAAQGLANSRLAALEQSNTLAAKMKEQLEKEIASKNKVIKDLIPHQANDLLDSFGVEDDQDLDINGEQANTNKDSTKADSSNADVTKKSGISRLINIGKHIAAEIKLQRSASYKSEESTIDANIIENLWPGGNALEGQGTAQSIWTTLKERNKNNLLNRPEKGEVRYYRLIEIEEDNAVILAETTRIYNTSWQKLDAQEEESKFLFDSLRRIGLNQTTIMAIYSVYYSCNEAQSGRFIKIQW